MNDSYRPGIDLEQQLNAATPSPDDHVLYCRECQWIGETNAAHARTTQCPECGRYGTRVWGHTPRS